MMASDKRKKPLAGTKKKPDPKKDRLTIFVSSTVYGIEELLDQVYAVLTGFGYEVWMSHKGTVPLYPNQTAFESCLLAVERCNLFLGIITPYYGSGVVDGDLSITHQELLKMIETNKPRWILAHDRVPFVRSFLGHLGYGTKRKRSELKLTKNRLLDDLRVIDMYEDAIRRNVKSYRDRKGNWVQGFSSNEDIMRFVTTQFIRYGDMWKLIRGGEKGEKQSRGGCGGRNYE